MKNILLAVAVFAAAFVSCNKETEVVPSPNSFTDGARIALTLTDDAADNPRVFVVVTVDFRLRYCRQLRYSPGFNIQRAGREIGDILPT